MLYTGKGDNGKTGLFGTKEKLSKSSPITEALGSLDEVNSYIGLCKAQIADASVKAVLHNVQNNLFITQAQIAGADKKIKEGEVKMLEDMIGDIEKQLSPITSFLIPGENVFSAHFDIARTLVRRAERRTVAISEQYTERVDAYTLAYLNRLSSLMYAYARWFAEKDGGKEHAPTY